MITTVPRRAPSGGGALHHAVLGVTPFEHADGVLAAALCRSGALGVLDLGRDAAASRAALAFVARQAETGFGVRVPEGVTFDAADLPSRVRVVVLARGHDPARFRGDGAARRAVLAEVVSLDEARRAIEAGVDGLVAKGCESGGRVGDETTFVLLQRLLAAVEVPVWAQGGIGLDTAAACVAGGAAGVVLDAALALVRESTLPAAVKAAVAAMDGSETAVVGGHRVFSRPDLPVAKLGEATAADVLPRLGARDLVESLVPAGQDAAFARRLADRFGTARRLVRAVERAIADGIELANRHQPLAPGAPLARAHHVEYPIAQGPMTRVSDRAAFAEAVAAGGALPFLALALLRGGEARALLRETASRLGSRPWGVGVLGFAPEALRDEQLEAIREVKPPVAIIAGGRPAQAAPLEAEGIATYLHVPSPGLLDLFLAEGARRFVFEGRECGGHVGPRTSFVLWEQQLARLAELPDVSSLSVLFAGGVHDARSAAMVAAMAAPLAARGARVGVLMGTAYLFTEEAVATGAIGAAFQEAALGCDRTVLLETAPGHATRCTQSEYAATFAAARRRLEAEGKRREETWEALEQLNLGRLRIAAKGVRREGDALVPVAEDEQRREGMFMIGQVAALRGARTTIAALHREVCEGSAALLARAVEGRGRYASERPAPRAVDVAIVGMACVYPGAEDLASYWTNVVSGVDAITEVPKERWSVAAYFDPASTDGKKTPSKWGGFIPSIAFDPVAYGIPPNSLPAIEPVQLLALEVARRALDDAGYGKRAFDRERTSVIFGAEAGTDLSAAYGFRALWPQYMGELPKALDAALPTLTEDSFPGVLANVIAGRIANRLDLGGVNYTVDAACASSLAAVELAVKELVFGTSDMVLCGGADLHNSINDYLMFSSVHALSKTGRCSTFDASADGIVLGEGVACLVLKRLADAERDGDRIHAVLRGVGGASDGRHLGLTAPRKEGQIRAVERAYLQAGLSPAEVGLVEAHGTGTVVGDRTELATLTDVWTAAGARPGACALGSVKSQIGHTKCAAGMAGLIKAALAVERGVLPPTLHLEAPNPGWDRAASPFVFHTAARPWVAERRRAAVSAFGFGGTNFHAVLEAHAEADPAAGVEGWPAELFLFRGPERAIAAERIAHVEVLLATGEPYRLVDLARAVCTAGSGPVQVAVVATDLADLRRKLTRARAFTADPSGVVVPRAGVRGGKLALLFPGQGSQRPGMLRDLFVAFPAMRRILRLGAKWADRMLPAAAFSEAERDAQAAALTDTRVAQPALGVAGLAVAELLQGLGVRPDMLAGHSYGELCALSVAGAIGEAELLALSVARAEAILAAAGRDPGAMAAVSAGADAVTRALDGMADVVVANENAPDQTVVSGPARALDAALARFAAAGLDARRIPVACAFHSPVVAGASARLAEHLANVAVGRPLLPVWSNATAVPHSGEPDALRAAIAEHVALPVRFAREIEAMYEAGARVFVEAGPGRVLTGLVGRILAGKPHVAVAVDAAGQPGIRPLLVALAELAVAGAELDVARLFEGRGAEPIDLVRPKSRKPSATAWLVNGQLARPVKGTAPRGGLAPVLAPVAKAAPAPAAAAAAASVTREIAAPRGERPVRPEPPPSVAPSRLDASIAAFAPAPSGGGGGSSARAPGERDGVVLEYLRGLREIVDAERQVLLRWLGEGPAVPVAPSTAPPSLLPLPRPSAPVSITPPAPESLTTQPPPSGAGAPVLDALLSVVSDKTGYPPEMLDLDLDLEAELGIDSIKRIEILGLLGARIGLGAQPGESRQKAVEDLSKVKTLRAIADLLEARRAKDAGASPVEIVVPPAPALPAHVDGPADVVGLASSAAPAPLGRFVVGTCEAPLAALASAPLAGRSFAITADGRGVAARLVGLLEARGARAAVALRGAPLGPIAPGGELVHLASLAPDEDAVEPAKALFERVREALGAGARRIVAVTGLSGPFGGAGAMPRAGLGGLLRSVAKERAGIEVRVVHVDEAGDVEDLAATTLAELCAQGGDAEVGWVDGARRALATVAADRADGAGAARPPLALEAGSVVVVTGGARGITALAALELARVHRCRFEILGRSPLPEAAEPPALAAASDAPALRRALLSAGEREPAAIEARVARVLADREARATLAALREAGASFAYHAVDVRDAGALRGVLAGIETRHGRIDGVIHGAGVLEDKRLEDKSRASFDRVFDTKVEGARTLLSALATPPRFVVLFGSIAGVLGNAGQVDYAAANDALDALAWWYARRTPARVLSIDWGPWAGTGMVGPELAAEYARRGMGLVDPREGVRALLAELDRADPRAPQIMLLAGAPDALAEAPDEPPASDEPSTPRREPGPREPAVEAR